MVLQLTTVATRLGTTLEALTAAQATVKAATAATDARETKAQKDALLAAELNVTVAQLRAALASVRGTTDGRCKGGSGTSSATTAGNNPTDATSAAAQSRSPSRRFSANAGERHGGPTRAARSMVVSKTALPPPSKGSPMASMQNKLTALAAIGAAALGGSAIANAATSSSGTSTTAAATQTQQAPAQRDPSLGGHVNGSETEKLLTGDTAARVKAAAEAKVSGGTVLRVENDADSTSPYEAHVQKADGSQVVVLVSSSFAVTSIDAMGHP
jgi:hypothetical protein